ncbi:MAG: hypothetical protein COT71_02615 [Candidatus Andersenbacteria bacterium CG10_big_fil_rev_8_21_14_0_10_54_11]|uniref:Uncharacterized protein n=1 Tax=Candidatus Andersenbacteria bacterium CG10_big_fil_rev_8_21_14_0_10_54_11 TaxID=1974485 RepID=A0A2M6WZ75_9BACT|nr:MAG: hypothetical protein COT71_02615 [Candidatus Andersenbacteria bacterium CG10_big_fil_rev_8_21_14_0_10_54_11]
MFCFALLAAFPGCDEHTLTSKAVKGIKNDHQKLLTVAEQQNKDQEKLKELTATSQNVLSSIESLTKVVNTKADKDYVDQRVDAVEKRLTEKMDALDTNTRLVFTAIDRQQHDAAAYLVTESASSAADGTIILPPPPDETDEVVSTAVPASAPPALKSPEDWETLLNRLNEEQSRKDPVASLAEQKAKIDAYIAEGKRDIAALKGLQIEYNRIQVRMDAIEATDRQQGTLLQQHDEAIKELQRQQQGLQLETSGARRNQNNVASPYANLPVRRMNSGKYMYYCPAY